MTVRANNAAGAGTVAASATITVGTTNNYANSAKLVGGTWTFIETMGASIFTDSYSLTSVDSSPNSSGDYYVWGTNQYGNLVIASYASSLGKWILLDQHTSFDNYFVFTFTDNNHISGCYYFIYPKGSSNLGSCYALTGSRSPLQALSNQRLNNGAINPVISLPLKGDPDEALRRAAASDTQPGFIDQGAVDAYLSLRKEIQ